MDALEFLKSTIPDFAGYDDEPARRIVDEQIRAFVGEALAILRDAHGEYFTEEAQGLYDRLLIHCEFADQDVVHDFEAAHGDVTPLADADAPLIQLAARAADVDAAALPEFLQKLKSAFENRDRAYRSSAV